METSYTDSHPFYAAETRNVRGIAQITSAWISAQGSKSPSAGSVYKFVNVLKDALKDG